MTKLKPPILRKERRISVLTLYFPATASIGVYRLDASGWHLVRELHGCKVE